MVHSFGLEAAVSRANREKTVRAGGVMSHEVGIWIDHKKAIVVTISAGHVSTKDADV